MTKANEQHLVANTHTHTRRRGRRRKKHTHIHTHTTQEEGRSYTLVESPLTSQLCVSTTTLSALKTHTLCIWFKHLNKIHVFQTMYSHVCFHSTKCTRPVVSVGLGSASFSGSHTTSGAPASNVRPGASNLWSLVAIRAARKSALRSKSVFIQSRGDVWASDIAARELLF